MHVVLSRGQDGQSGKLLDDLGSPWIMQSQCTGKLRDSLNESAPQARYQRAFLAQRGGQGSAIERKLLIRAGGLKTCWTKPQGAAVPQLWALQASEGWRGAEKTAAKGGERRLERTR
jgi:hypothetical protein